MKLINPTTTAEPPLVLAVDDQPENLRLLGHALTSEKLSIAFALSGEEALCWLEDHQPDLILLDVNMPGLNGLECCRRIKSNEKTADIPVIFLTARVEVEDIEAGFLAGAVDYVTKPFNSTELKARVATHVSLQTQRKVLELHLKQNSELLGIIAHDIRGPIASIRALAEVLIEEFPEQVNKSYGDSNVELLQAITVSADKTIYILNELLNAKVDHSGKVKAELTEFSLPEIFEDIRIRNAGQALRKKISLEFDPGNSPIVKADRSLLGEAVDNLVSNAVKYSPEGKCVKIEVCSDSDGNPHLLVSDEGQGFREEDYSRLYQRFQPLSAHPTGGEPSFGLGLALVKEFMLAQGGDVTLVSKPNESAVFMLSFNSAS